MEYLMVHSNIFGSYPIFIFVFSSFSFFSSAVLKESSIRHMLSFFIIFIFVCISVFDINQLYFQNTRGSSVVEFSRFWKIPRRIRNPSQECAEKAYTST